MQAIPTTGVAMGVQYLENQNIAPDFGDDKPVVVCSLGDASVTEGEVAEAFQMAALKQFPILYFVQDNEWDISANAAETRSKTQQNTPKGLKELKLKALKATTFLNVTKHLKK